MLKIVNLSNSTVSGSSGPLIIDKDKEMLSIEQEYSYQKY